MINKVSFLVLLYNKEIQKSNTLLSLLCSSLIFNDCKLVIWNNGPCNLNSVNIDEFVKLGFDVDIIETIDNISLSRIYNSFIDRCPSHKYVILDDDSLLNHEYLVDVMQANDDFLSIPIIKSNGKYVSPLLNGQVIDNRNEVINEVYSIGSGIVLGSKFVKLILDSYRDVFDERFYFYGVDTSFFCRVNDTSLQGKVRIISEFEHSLSRLDNTESKSKSDFRRKERAYDLALQLRYYYTMRKTIKKFFIITLSYIVKTVTGRSTQYSYNHFIIALVRGKHHKCASKNFYR
jgi:hypothetical protein